MSLPIPMLLALIAAGLAGTAAILLHLRRAASRRRQAQAGYFAACLPLFSDVRIRAEPHGFPRLGGQWRGLPVDLQVFPDTLSLRKLPALWLLVTLPTPLPLRGRTDLMARPAGGETFSRFSSLPVAIATPDGAPHDLAIRTDVPGVLSPNLARRLVAEFDRSGIKELVIGPTGARIVWLAEEADRTRYLLHRDAELGLRPLDARLVEHILIRLADLVAEVTAADNERAPHAQAG